MLRDPVGVETVQQPPRAWQRRSFYRSPDVAPATLGFSLPAGPVRHDLHSNPHQTPPQVSDLLAPLAGLIDNTTRSEFRLCGTLRPIPFGCLLKERECQTRVYIYTLDKAKDQANRVLNRAP